MRFGSLIPLLFVLVVATVGATRQQGHLNAVRVERDSLASAFRRYARARQRVVFAGDTLPRAHVLTASGDTIPLRALALQGYRFLYFYRDDCQACRALAPLLDQSEVSRSPRTARIQLSYLRQLIAKPSAGQFAWLVDTTAGRPVGSVPALVVVDADGRVTATADFEARAVVSLLSLHGLISRASFDSALVAARASTLVGESEPDSLP